MANELDDSVCKEAVEFEEVQMIGNLQISAIPALLVLSMHAYTG